MSHFLNLVAFLLTSASWYGCCAPSSTEEAHDKGHDLVVDGSTTVHSQDAHGRHVRHAHAKLSTRALVRRDAGQNHHAGIVKSRVGTRRVSPSDEAVSTLEKETSLRFPRDVISHSNPSCAPFYHGLDEKLDTRLATVVGSTCRTTMHQRESGSSVGKRGHVRHIDAQPNCSRFDEPCCLKAGLLVYAMVTQLMREEGLVWFGWCGTLLGAVRHGGVIPHDHDMDLGVVLQTVEDEKKVERVVQRAADMGMTPLNRNFVTHYGFSGSGAMHLDVFKFVPLVAFPLLTNERGNRSGQILGSVLKTEHAETWGIPFDDQASGHDAQGRNLHHKDLFPLKNCSFHGTPMPCPHDHVKILTMLYGPLMSSNRDSNQHAYLAQGCLVKHMLPNIGNSLRRFETTWRATHWRDAWISYLLAAVLFVVLPTWSCWYAYCYAYVVPDKFVLDKGG